MQMMFVTFSQEDVFQITEPFPFFFFLVKNHQH